MFAILILLLFSCETFSRIQNWNPLGLPERNPTLTSKSSKSYVEPASTPPRLLNSDFCCVKKTFYKNGRVNFICKSEHPDCFAKSNAVSPSFGLCESVVDSTNNVIGCRCTA